MSCAKTACCSRTREPMLDAATLLNLGEKGAAALRSLLSVASDGVSGLARFNLPDGDFYALARTVAALYEERNRFKNILDALAAQDVVAIDTTNATVTVSFGPGKQYKLNIPIPPAVNAATEKKPGRQLFLPLN